MKQIVLASGLMRLKTHLLLLCLLDACSRDGGQVGTLAAATPTPNVTADSTVRARRILADSGSLDFIGGSISRDGQFVTGTDGSGNLATRDLRSGRQHALTLEGDFTKGNNALNSRVAPDGKRVAFIWSFGAPSYAFELRVMGVDGSGQRVLESGPAFASHVPGDWTPDSRRLLITVTSKDDTKSIAMLTVADGSVRTLKSLDWRYPGNLRVSPDGRRVAYAVAPERGSSARDVYVLDLDGTRERRLTTDDEWKDVIGWSDDGRTLYYATRKNDASSVWRMTATGSAPTGTPQLVRSDIWGMIPIDVVKGTVYYAVTMRRVAVGAMTLDVEAGRALEPPTVVAAGDDIAETGRGAWSPDGQRLVFVRVLRSPSAGLTALVFRDVTSGAEHQMSLALSMTEILEWAPDGRSITVSGYERGRQGRYRVDLATGRAELLDRLVSYTDIPQPSPDGRLEYVVRADSASDSAFVIVRQRGATEERVLFRERRISRIVLSPDGKHLGVLGVPHVDARSNYIAIVPTFGGATRVVHNAPRPRYIGIQLNWTPDSRFLLFVQHDVATQTYEFWKAAPAADSTQRIVSGNYPAPAYARLAPDGRRIAYTSLAGPNVSELWVLENLSSSRREAALRP